MRGHDLRAGDRVPAFEVRVLGPVQAIRAGRELALGGPMQRAVLAMLAVEPGRVVPAGRLIEELWRGRAPAGAARTLRSYVSRLRAVLEPDAVLASRAGGYVLSVGPGRLDSAEFERLTGAGRAALEAGMAAVAADRFGQALGLWRGRALAGVAEVEMLALEAGRLEGLRLAAVEGRVEADLALGRHGELPAELERLVAEHPVRERFWCQLVLALYRAGRQADALAACRRARSMLAEELGLEPGPELGRLERQVLRHEVAAPPRPIRHNLPAPLTSFVGREQEVAGLERMLGGVRMATLTGPGGTGKTRLALECASRLAGRYRDGVWLADLAGITGPDLVPAQVMAALGVRQSADVPVLEALRFRLRSADLLLVLDNCEHLLEACAALAAGLLRGAPGLRVLATSREPLGVPGEICYGVPPLAVPPESAGQQALAAAPAVRLFLDRAAAARGGTRPGGPAEAVAGICRDLDGLPLAIELAAARASVLSVPEIRARLADRFRLLAYRRPVPGSRHQALKAAVDWSYELLPEPEARVFRELSVFAGGFAVAEVAAVCCGGDEAAAIDVIDRLAAKSLVAAEAAAGVTRYRMLETLRQYAAERLAESGQAPLARRRHAAAFLSLAEREPHLGVLAREHDNFRAALDGSLSGDAGADDAAGPRLALALDNLWRGSGFFGEARGWLERALELSGQGSGLRARLCWLLGAVLHQAGDLDGARAVLSDGSRAAAAAGEAAVLGRIRVQLAEIALYQGGPAAELLAEEQEAAKILDAEGDAWGLAEAWLSIAWVHFQLGDVAASQRAVAKGAAGAHASGNRYAQLIATNLMIATFQALPVPADVAIARAEQLLETVAGDPMAHAHGLDVLAVLYAYAGRLADARSAIARARAAFERSGEKLFWATSAEAAGRIEMIAGDYAAAGRVLAEGRDALRAMGERGALSCILVHLAEIACEQGHLDEALRLTGESEAMAAAGDIAAQAPWRAVRARVLARKGRFAEARQLVSQAVTLAQATSYVTVLAEVLVAEAEVARLAGAAGEAEASLRAALEIYEDRRVPPLAERARAALAGLPARARGGSPGSASSAEDAWARGAR